MSVVYHFVVTGGGGLGVPLGALLWLNSYIAHLQLPQNQQWLWLNGTMLLNMNLFRVTRHLRCLDSVQHSEYVESPIGTLLCETRQAKRRTAVVTAFLFR